MQKLVAGLKENVANGEQKRKDHTGCLEKMTWDKTGLENEVRNYMSHQWQLIGHNLL